MLWYCSGSGAGILGSSAAGKIYHPFEQEESHFMACCLSAAAVQQAPGVMLSKLRQLQATNKLASVEDELRDQQSRAAGTQASLLA